jgi:hypothetical protein
LAVAAAVVAFVYLVRAQTALIQLAIFLAAQAPLLLAVVAVQVVQMVALEQALPIILLAIQAPQVGLMAAVAALADRALVFLLEP